MRTAKMTDLIGSSFGVMWRVLFQPFGLKRWLRLLLIAFLAGAFGTSMNYNFGGTDALDDADSTEISEEASIDQDDNALSFQGDEGEQEVGSGESAIPVILSFLDQNISVTTILWAFLILFPITILVVWFNSRFSFVWLNAVIKNEPDISEPFSRTKKEGQSYFKLKFLITLFEWLWWLLWAAVIYWLVSGAGMLEPDYDFSWGNVFAILMPPAVISIVSFVLIRIFVYLLDHFVVFFMLMDESKFGPAWNKFCAFFGNNKGDFFVFLLVSILMAIVFMVIGIALFIMIVLGAILGGLVVFGLPYLLFVTMFNIPLIFGIYAIATGLAFSFFMIFLFSCSSLPAALFARVFSMQFVMAHDCGYAQESLENYSKRKLENWPKTISWILKTVIVLLVIAFIGVATVGIGAAAFGARTASQTNQNV